MYHAPLSGFERLLTLRGFPVYNNLFRLQNVAHFRNVFDLTQDDPAVVSLNH